MMKWGSVSISAFIDADLPGLGKIQDLEAKKGRSHQTSLLWSCFHLRLYVHPRTGTPLLHAIASISIHADFISKAIRSRPWAVSIAGTSATGDLKI